MTAEPLPLPGLPPSPARPAYDAAAVRAWALCAPAIAGQPRVRVSRDGGRSYPRRWEPALTTERPEQPAAVRLHDAQGNARCLALDLDVGRGGVRQVRADTDGAVQLLTRIGARVLVDESPTGGRHVYLPLRTPRPLAEIAPMLRALAALLKSLDMSPMLNERAGCLRPTGAAHRRGGSQRLLTDWAEASSAVLERNDDTIWLALRRELGLNAAASPPPPTPAPTRANACQRL